MNYFHISAKNLATLVLPRFCAADFWLLLHRTEEWPFLFPPPKIFNVMEKLQRDTIAAIFENTGAPPDWFGPFADVTSMIDKVGKIRLIDERKGVELVGIPDQFFGYEDDSIAVIDFKTASPSSAAPLYETQSLVYAYLAERLPDPFTVSSAGLFYFELTPDEDQETKAERATENGFLAPFNLIPVEVALNHNKLIPELLRDARKIWASSTPPAAKDGCLDCKRLKALLELIASVQKSKQAVEAIDSAAYQRWLAETRYDFLNAVRASRYDLRTGSDLSDSCDTVLANWDVSGEE